ncbi:hypothetical protein JCM18903_1801 [Psychrobacter sp. JCM 18903]|nr:hypothetical protein JCM18903_1801 [Psychrobacter sp. JCM 18903]
MWGYIDSSGKTVVPLNYLNADSFHNGLAVVAKENGYGMINKDNKIIVLRSMTCLFSLIIIT